MRKYVALSLLLTLPLAAVAQTAAPAADAVKITPYGIVTLDLYKNSGLFGSTTAGRRSPTTRTTPSPPRRAPSSPPPASPASAST